VITVAISVNMFRCRLTIEAQPRWKKGHPPQRTTGEASASWIHVIAAGERIRSTGRPGSRSDMASRKVGIDRPRQIQNRLVMSTSSGFGASRSAIWRGSRAMPQIGQVPGPVRTISGCIGQVHSDFDARAGTGGVLDAAGLPFSTGPARSGPR